MLKREEISDPNSCLNKAAEDEPLFTLRGKDPAAAATIRFWVEERLRLGIDMKESRKLAQARVDAADFERYCAQLAIKSPPAGVTVTGWYKITDPSGHVAFVAVHEIIDVITQLKTFRAVIAGMAGYLRFEAFHPGTVWELASPFK